MPGIAPALLQAYFDSRYSVACPGGLAEFHIGGPLPECLRRPFALLTAWNPRSEPLDRVRNDARETALRVQLDSAGWPHLPARGEGPDGWVEESVAIFEIPLPDALSLARQYGQNALVWGDGRHTELVLCSGERPSRPEPGI